ncbi:Las1-like-domain-containing protein [Lipomyces chichibuensis]|uniref:Las1-like-domain-containing protein n=1 Tax=Lipomyces chichibuensis TaxID=1546026 RepID=UPI00334406B3
MSKHPRSVPYRDLAELQQLYTWFFDSPDERMKAISLVKAYTTRGHVPYGIECTAILISSILLDSTSAAEENTIAIRLAYSSSIIRFVNGFLDPHQTTQFAMPLHALALKIGMPTMFVELRHACTHESLPRLDVLRHAATQAVEWLRYRYWKPELERLGDAQKSAPARVVECIENWINMFGTDESDDDSDDADDDPTLEVTRPDFEEAKYKWNDSSANGRAYWRILKLLAQLSEQDLEAFNTAGVDMIFSHGIRENVTSLRSLKLFSPLLQYIAPAVTDALLKRCLEEVVKSYKAKEQYYFPVLQPSTSDESSIIYLGRDKSEDPALSHARNWIRHILSHASSVPTTTADAREKNIGGFLISYMSFVKLCLRLSPPTPTLLDFLKLAKKHMSSGRNDPIHKLVDTYANQVGILNNNAANGSVKKTKRRKDADELSRTIENIDKKAEKIAQYEYEKKRKLATAVSLTPDDKVVESWTLSDGPWSSRPIGVL